MTRFFIHFRMALWRAFQHDAFAVAKAAAFSAILTIFPAILVLASILSLSNTTEALFRELTHAIGRILPEGTSAAVLQFFTGNKPVRFKFVVTIIAITLWTGSGVMISWMEGFRNAYQMPKIWGLVKERMISFLLVILAGIPLVFASFLLVFGNQIEGWIMYRVGHELGPYPRPVDSLALDHRYADQHRGNRAYLSSWRAPHPAVAPRASWLGSGHRAVVRLHGWLRSLPPPLRQLRRHLRIGRHRHRASDLALPGFHGHFDWRGIQRCAISPLPFWGALGSWPRTESTLSQQ
jgi:hypothetical protein